LLGDDNAGRFLFHLPRKREREPTARAVREFA
jgi:hypothetical protein